MKQEPPGDPTRIEGVCAAVLAGGESRRFGQSKAHALLGGKPLIHHVLQPLLRLFDDVTIITHHPEAFERFNVDVAADILRGPGALGGLLSALVHARCERCFVVACDMPFLRDDVIRKMFEWNGCPDVLVPTCRREAQPLHALYSRNCIPVIRKAVLRGNFRIIDFYHEVAHHKLDEAVWGSLDPHGWSFFNVNTPEDFETAKERFEQGAEGREGRALPGGEGGGA